MLGSDPTRINESQVPTSQSPNLLQAPLQLQLQIRLRFRVSPRRNRDGESHRPLSKEHPWHEPSEPSGEDPPYKDPPEHLLERAVLRPHRRNPSRQGYGARPPRRHLWRHPQTHSLHVPRHEDAPDPT